MKFENYTTDLAEFVCDKVCKFPNEVADQEELDHICEQCKMNQLIDEINAQYNKINDFDKSQSAKLMSKLGELRLELSNINWESELDELAVQSILR